MSLLAISPHQTIKLRMQEYGREHQVNVVDIDDEALVLKVDQDLAGIEPSGTVYIEFPALKYYWRAAVEVQAFFNNWWFLARPHEENSERIQRRNFVRITFEGSYMAVPVTPLGQPAGDLTTIHLADLSANGCLATCGLNLELGDYLLVFLKLPGLSTPSITCRIVRATKTETGNMYGILFEGLSMPDQEQLARFVTDEIRRYLQQGVDITRPGG